jgi:Trk K+ transport system NAD-binding subunit
MKQIAVIGSSHFGLVVARELSMSGFSVSMIVEPAGKVPVRSNQTITNQVIPVKLNELSSVVYDFVILVMDGNLELALKSLIILQAAKTENVLICAQSDEHQQVADLFTVGKNWCTVRLDRHIGSMVKNLLIDFSPKQHV